MHVAAFGELFAAYDLDRQLCRTDGAPPAAERTTYASVITATGRGIRLASTLSLDRELLLRSHPSGASHLPEREMEDWCRELNNQLLGRLKNKMLRAGCDLSAGLPVLVRGTDVVAIASDDEQHREYSFTSRYGCLTFTLAMLVSPDLTLDLEGGAPLADEVRREGVLALF